MPAGDKPNLSSNLSAHPTLVQRLGFDYYYRPTNPIALSIWRWQVWVGATFTLGMLEPIEVLALGIVFSFLTALFWLSIYKYFPAHFAFLRRRSAYYLYGDEQTPVFTLDSESLLSIWRPLASWVKKFFGAQEKAVEAVKGVVTEVVETVTSTAVRTARTASAVMESRKLQEL